MSEESIQLVEFTVEDTKKFKADLEEKISAMWRAIEDLKQKVTEEKELLRKERNENERMIKEHVLLRRQLSLFHLPHCPILANSECPVHSRTSSGAIQESDNGSILHGDQFVKPYNSEPDVDEERDKTENLAECNFQKRNYEETLQDLKSGFQIDDNEMSGIPPRQSTVSTDLVNSLITPTREVSYMKLDPGMRCNGWFPGDSAEGRSDNSNHPPLILYRRGGSRTEVADEQTMSTQSPKSKIE